MTTSRTTLGSVLAATLLLCFRVESYLFILEGRRKRSTSWQSLPINRMTKQNQDEDDDDTNKPHVEASAYGYLTTPRRRRRHEESTTLQPFVSLRDTVNFLTEQKELWSQDWHDSFVRNGLVDFVPPLSSSLRCLCVDGSDHHDHHRRRVLDELSERSRNEVDSESKKETIVRNDAEYLIDGQESILVDRLTHESVLSSLFESTGRTQPTFDCILDRGLLDDLLSMDDGCGTDDVAMLLLEATRHIREHGIYIVVTKQELLKETKEYLINVGTVLGMQWKFDLDGISNENATVSVARKYFAGELPTAGKLAATVKRY